MYTLTIKVTREILEASKNCASGGWFISHDIQAIIGANCGVAQAVREIFPNAFVSNKVIFTELEDVDFTATKGTEKYEQLMNIAIPLPEKAQAFIKVFDGATPEERVNMSPIEFDIQVPEETLTRVIDIEEIREILKTSKTLELHEL